MTARRSPPVLDGSGSCSRCERNTRGMAQRDRWSQRTVEELSHAATEVERERRIVDGEGVGTVERQPPAAIDRGHRMTGDEAVDHLVPRVGRTRRSLLHAFERHDQPSPRRRDAHRRHVAAGDDRLALGAERAAVVAGHDPEDEAHAARQPLALSVELLRQRPLRRRQPRD